MSSCRATNAKVKHAAIYQALKRMADDGEIRKVDGMYEAIGAER